MCFGLRPAVEVRGNVRCGLEIAIKSKLETHLSKDSAVWDVLLYGLLVLLKSITLFSLRYICMYKTQWVLSLYCLISYCEICSLEFVFVHIYWRYSLFLGHVSTESNPIGIMSLDNKYIQCLVQLDLFQFHLITPGPYFAAYSSRVFSLSLSIMKTLLLYRRIYWNMICLYEQLLAATCYSLPCARKD